MRKKSKVSLPYLNPNIKKKSHYAVAFFDAFGKMPLYCGLYEPWAHGFIYKPLSQNIYITSRF